MHSVAAAGLPSKLGRAMQTASRDLRGTGGASRIERVALTAAVVAFAVIVAVGALAAVRQARHLDDRRASVLSEHSDPAQAAGDQAEAFRTFRRSLDDGARFSLVYGAEVDRNQRGFYRLFAGYYLYPAVAVTRLELADAVMVFGPPPPAVRRSFDPIGELDGVWLGRRTGS